jgi:hypothetical protein
MCAFPDSIVCIYKHIKFLFSSPNSLILSTLFCSIFTKHYVMDIIPIQYDRIASFFLNVLIIA